MNKSSWNEYVLKKQRLLALSGQFNFKVLQAINKEDCQFTSFQRFCLLLIIIHGEIERVNSEKTEEFLKSLNIQQEVTNIKETIDTVKFKLEDLRHLKQE